MNSLVDVGTKSHCDHSQKSERLWWSRARYKTPIIIGNYVLGMLAKRIDFESLIDYVLCKRLVSTTCLMPVVMSEL